jgi:hypothetical protein
VARESRAAVHVEHITSTGGTFSRNQRQNKLTIA